MIIYDGLKSDFMTSVEADTIAEEIEARILEQMGKHTGKSEFNSWMQSLQYMYKVLNDQEIPEDSGIAIEYNIPQTSKRVDFIISGLDENNKENVVIIELKQWQEINALEGRDALVETFTGGALRKVVHPSYQAWSYASMIKDYNVAVQNEEITLHPCAYLHNYRRHDNDPLDQEQYLTYLEDAPAYTKGQVKDLRAFIKKCVKYGDHKDILYKIDHGRIKPSKSLQNEIASMLKGNPEFTLIDDQKVAYEEILNTSRESINKHEKNVIIVEGGPGTGKTVLAINLLSQLTNEDQFVQYVSKNSAPRTVYAAKLKGKIRKTTVDNMFKGSGQYTEVRPDTIDTLLVDEAHRLNEKSGMFKNMGENQIKEIINASLCSVFFIDEHQRVTLSDIGSVKEIEKWADEAKANITYLELESQFRCNGSDGYLAWIDQALEIRNTANLDLEDLNYEFKVCDSPNEVRNLIIEKNNINHRSRMLAGYCWEWIKDGKKDTNIHDIVIGDFAMSWNLDSGTPFAIDDTSVNEIGCIHTSQGLEFDYVGVIIGNDLRYENGHIVTDFTKRASTDQSLKGIKKLDKENHLEALRVSDEIIKNTYRTLLTRGMKGCYVYCTDQKLADYLKNIM